MNERQNQYNNNPTQFVTRLEKFMRSLLISVTNQLEDQAGSSNERLEQLAMRLVRAGTIVLIVNLDKQLRRNRDAHIQAWVNTYVQLYYLLNQVLFEMTDQPSAYIVDDQYPTIVVFKAENLAIMNVFAELIVPHIAKQQRKGYDSILERKGVIAAVLEELFADGLSMEAQQFVHNRALELLEALTTANVKQGSLTRLNMKYFDGDDSDIILPIIKEETPRPNTLPEKPKHRHTEDLQKQARPVKILKMPTMSDPADDSDNNSGANSPAIPSPTSMLNRLRRSK